MHKTKWCKRIFANTLANLARRTLNCVYWEEGAIGKSWWDSILEETHTSLAKKGWLEDNLKCLCTNAQSMGNKKEE